MSSVEIRQLKAFGQQVSVQENRDLNLLRAIEKTLEYIDEELGHVELFNQIGEQFIEKIRHTDSCIDENGELVALFEKARESVGARYNELRKRHDAALNDHSLCDEDGVADAYEKLITATADLYNNINELSWVIGENSADHDDLAPGDFNNPDDLFKAMGV